MAICSFYCDSISPASFFSHSLFLLPPKNIIYHFPFYVFLCFKSVKGLQEKEKERAKEVENVFEVPLSDKKKSTDWRRNNYN